MSQVVVTAERPAVGTSIDRKSYSVTSDLQAQGGSIADALRNVPSVDVDVLGNVRLRGDANVTILIDGKPAVQFEGAQKGQALEDFPASRIDRVEVSTTPPAELAANGSGGVINLITKRSQGAGFTGSARASVGTYLRDAASLNMGYNSSRLSLASDAFYRHDTQHQDVHDKRSAFESSSGAFDQSTRGSTQNAVIETKGTSTSAALDVDDRTRVTGDARFNDRTINFDNAETFTLQAPGALPEGLHRKLSVSQSAQDGALGVGLRENFDPLNHVLNLGINYQFSDDRRRRDGVTVPDLGSSSADRQVMRTRLDRYSMKADYVRPFSGGPTLKLGALLEWDRDAIHNNGLTGPTSDALQPDPTFDDQFRFVQRLFQAYASYEASRGPFSAQIGLRFEATGIDLRLLTTGEASSPRFQALLPSLHFSWSPSEADELTASYSRRQQRPAAEQFNPFRIVLDPVTIRAGNPELRPQDTDSIELGYQHRDGGSTFIATLYARSTRRGVADVVMDIGNGVLLTEPENVADASQAGLELVADQKLSPTLSGRLSADLYRASINAPGALFAGHQHAEDVSAKAAINWRPTPSDFLQLNASLSGRRLTPQGHFDNFPMFALGYRHDINSQFSVLLIGQDVLDTFKDRQVIETPLLRARLNRDVNARTFMARLVWTFGGKAKDREIDLTSDSVTQP